MDEITTIEETIPLNGDRHNHRRLQKASRAGGPVTCVSLRRVGTKIKTDQDSKSYQDSEFARVWSLGPYLHRSFRGVRSESLIFPQEYGGTIHGIAFREESSEYQSEEDSTWDAVVFGGKHLVFCHILQNIDQAVPSPICRREIQYLNQGKASQLLASDWIWDAVVIPSSRTDNRDCRRSERLILGLGRHTVEIWEISQEIDSVINLRCSRRIPGVPPCLIMSMNILNRDDELLIAAGTAFQTIQVWTVSLFDTENNEAVKDKFESAACLEGHKGVIHSVVFSRDGSSIISTSDDRSVRLWTKRNSWDIEWIAWGHTARVWTASFVTGGVASAAEDSTIRIWSIDNGKQIGCVTHGTGLWSMNVFDDMAIVGATDGTASLYDLSRKFLNAQAKKITILPVPDDRPSRVESAEMSMKDDTSKDLVTSGKQSKKKKKPKRAVQTLVGLCWYRQNDILVATRTGSLLILSMDDSTCLPCKPWWTLTSCASTVSARDGCCMAINEDIVAIGTTRGDIVVQTIREANDPRCPTQWVLSAATFRAVQGLQWIPESHLLISFHVQNVLIWDLQTMTEKMTSNYCPSYILRIETKGIPKCCTLDSKNHQLFVGDTRGNISLYQLGGDEMESSVAAKSVLLRAHNKEHVNMIKIMGNRLLSLGNDGCIHTSYRSDGKICAGFSRPVLSMASLVKLLSKDEMEDFGVCGYYGNHLRMVDGRTGYEHFSFNTGGRQRISDLHISKFDSSTDSFSRLALGISHKDGTNSIEIHNESANRIFSSTNTHSLVEGIAMHGETIFDACFFRLGGTGSLPLLLTASEDCGSKISVCENSRLIDTVNLTPQESCARAVCISQSGNSSALIVVGGGKLALQFFSVRIVNSSESIRSIMDFEIVFLGKGYNRLKASIDQRINVVKGFPLDETFKKHLVIAADSAGQCHLNIVTEDPTSKPPACLLTKGSDRPILSLSISKVLDHILVALGDTAGIVSLYILPRSEVAIHNIWPNIAAYWKPFYKYQAHQMGCNGLSTSVEDFDGNIARCSILTVGDDQSIVVRRIEVAKNTGSVNDLSSLSLRALESTSNTFASFSALKDVSEYGEQDKHYAVTAGYSGSIALWERKTSSVEKKEHLPIDVGDVNTLATIEQEKDTLIAVAGLGIELFVVENSN